MKHLKFENNILDGNYGKMIKTMGLVIFFLVVFSGIVKDLTSVRAREGCNLSSISNVSSS